MDVQWLIFFLGKMCLRRFRTTATDITCSHFIPTCAECSTTFPAPGVAAVRGESAMAACRQCHRKMGMFELQFMAHIVFANMVRL